MDVPITIFFCTKRKRANFIEAIMADRDKNGMGSPSDNNSQDNSIVAKLLETDRSGTQDERGERIEDLI